MNYIFALKKNQCHCIRSIFITTLFCDWLGESHSFSVGTAFQHVARRPFCHVTKYGSSACPAREPNNVNVKQEWGAPELSLYLQGQIGLIRAWICAGVPAGKDVLVWRPGDRARTFQHSPAAAGGGCTDRFLLASASREGNKKIAPKIKTKTKQLRHDGGQVWLPTSSMNCIMIFPSLYSKAFYLFQIDVPKMHTHKRILSPLLVGFVPCPKICKKNVGRWLSKVKTDAWKMFSFK